MHRFAIRTALLFCCTAMCVSGMRREYFLRIEEVTWNYAPSGMNLIQNQTLQEDEWVHIPLGYLDLNEVEQHYKLNARSLRFVLRIKIVVSS